MSAELENVCGEWELLGASDPYWAVLTQYRFHDGNDRPEFFELGRADIAQVVDLLGGHNRALGETVLDFGSGVGRLSYALAEKCGSVVGVDASESMVREANANNLHPDRVRFVHNTASTLPFADGEFDAAVSLITLQHIPAAYAIRYLLEMVRIVRDGGHLVFQLPSELRTPEPMPREDCRATLRVLDVPEQMRAGSRGYVTVSVRNDSQVEWAPHRMVYVGNHWTAEGVRLVLDDGRVDVPCPLGPGESAEVQLEIRAPETPGPYELELDLVQELVAWWEDLADTLVSRRVEVVGVDTPVPDGHDGAESRQPAEGTMRMHGIEPDVVRGIMTAVGCRVLDVVADARTGEDWVSYLYAVEVRHGQH